LMKASLKWGFFYF